LAAGHQVICLDNFSTGMRRNIVHLKRVDRFNVIAHDIIHPLDLEVDEIYNLACPASPPHYQADPIHTTKTCVLGSLNLLELAARTGARIPGGAALWAGGQCLGCSTGALLPSMW
jgi:UDP-glucuronate decarboxylase